LLKGGTSQLVSEYYRYNTSRTVIFLKTTVRKRLKARIRTVVVLTGGKLTVFKLCNYEIASSKVHYDFWSIDLILLFVVFVELLRFVDTLFYCL
jgi:hypothetical protein